MTLRPLPPLLLIGLALSCGGGSRSASMSFADFEAVFGKPDRVESRPGDLVWEYWFFPCREGVVRLPAYLDEQPGDEVRVVTGEPELIRR